MNATETIRLGDHLVPVVPQRHARLRHRLSAKDFEAIASANYAAESYRVLCVLIPAIDPANPRNNGGGIPLWEWEGYGSLEDYENDNYDEDQDKSPTTAEIVNAFETALMVSGAGRLGKIISLVETTGAISATEATRTPSPLVSVGNTGESA